MESSSAATKKSRSGYHCTKCNSVLSTQAILREHTKRFHGDADKEPSFMCSICRNFFNGAANFDVHKKTHEFTSDFILLQSAYRGAYEIHRKVVSGQQKTLKEAFTLDTKRQMIKVIQFILLNKHSIIYQIAVGVELYKLNPDQSVFDIFQPSLSSTRKPLNETFDSSAKSIIYNNLNAHIQQISDNLDDLVLNGSNWVINDVIFIDINIASKKAKND